MSLQEDYLRLQRQIAETVNDYRSIIEGQRNFVSPSLNDIMGPRHNMLINQIDAFIRRVSGEWTWNPGVTDVRLFFFGGYSAPEEEDEDADMHKRMVELRYNTNQVHAEAKRAIIISQAEETGGLIPDLDVSGYRPEEKTDWLGAAMKLGAIAIVGLFAIGVIFAAK